MQEEAIEIESNGNYFRIVLNKLTEDLEKEIETKLADYCYGSTFVEDDPESTTLENVLHEFFRTYDAKPHNVKVGLAGELVFYILYPNLSLNLAITSIYFNKEESNVKKGFDLTFFSSDEKELWYGEIKSGELNGIDCINQKIEERIKEAAQGLYAMFKTNVAAKRWDAAKLDAYVTLKGAERTSVLQLLGNDKNEALKETEIKQKNAIVVGVVMHDHLRDKISMNPIAGIQLTNEQQTFFAKRKIIAIQQDEVESIIELLRAKAKKQK